MMRANYLLVMAMTLLAVAATSSLAFEGMDAGLEFRLEPETGQWDADTEYTIAIEVRSVIGPVTLGGFQVDFTYNNTESGAHLQSIDTESFVSTSEMSQDYSDPTDDGNGSVFRAVNLMGGGDLGLNVSDDWVTLAELTLLVCSEPVYPMEVVVSLFAAFDMTYSFYDASWLGGLPFHGGSYTGPQVCEIDGIVYEDGDLNPANPCDRCDVSQSTTGWSWNGECSTISVPIAYGYNILGHAIDQPQLAMASQITADIAAQGGAVTEVHIWVPATGTWRTYDPTFPIDDFLIRPADGFIVRASVESTWEISGLTLMDDPQSIESVNGYTLVAIPSDDYQLASGFIAAMNGSGCQVSEMSRWDTATGGWETYDPTFPIIDYSVDRISGYFLRGAGNCQFDLNP